MKLIVGLGNPGKEYENTRHNVGFLAIDKIAKFLNVSLEKNKFQGKYVDFNYHNEKVILLKPQKYMNLSGEVISAFVSFYKIPIEDILIISDDLDLDLGKLKLKYKGSSGGHNGLKNIEQHLGTNAYKRLKIGISNDKTRDTKDYVLEKMNAESLEQLNLDIVVSVFKDYFTLTFSNLMNKYNKK